MSGERVQVRPDVGMGWLWRVDEHRCSSYVCGLGACPDSGWRLTRRWAVRAGRRRVRVKERIARRWSVGWQAPGTATPGEDQS